MYEFFKANNTNPVVLPLIYPALLHIVESNLKAKQLPNSTILYKKNMYIISLKFVGKCSPQVEMNKNLDLVNWREMYNKGVKDIFSLWIWTNWEVMSYVQKSYKKHTDSLGIASLSKHELDYFAKKPCNCINNILILWHYILTWSQFASNCFIWI